MNALGSPAASTCAESVLVAIERHRQAFDVFSRAHDGVACAIARRRTRRGGRAPAVPRARDSRGRGLQRH